MALTPSVLPEPEPPPQPYRREFDDVLEHIMNDGVGIQDVIIQPPPEIYHIHDEDMLQRDHLNEDIDLQDEPPTVRSVSARHRIQWHVDGGSNRSITNDLTLLTDTRNITPHPINSIQKDEPALICTKAGFLNLRTNEGAVIRVRTFYSEASDDTILSPGDVVMHEDNPYKIWIQYSDMEAGRGWLKFRSKDSTYETAIDTYLKNGLWYTYQYPYNPDECYDKPIIRALSGEASHELWHQRLGHPGSKVTENIAKCVEGVPTFQKGRNHFYACNSCTKAKMQRLPKQPSPPTPIKNFGQQFHVDFGFVRGSDFRTTDGLGRIVTSINGYNSYLSIIDSYTRYQWIYLSPSKDPPIEFMQSFLDRYGLKDGPVRNIRTDQGGELWGSSKFTTLVKLMGYLIEPTGSDDAAQNGLVERPNQTLGQMTRTLLYNAGLGSEYWSYAIVHAVYLKNRLPHAAFDHKTTPFEKFTGLKPDLRNLRTWGSRVLVRKPGKRPAKLDPHTSEGIFLNYTATNKNIIYLDTQTGREKIASNIVFDEASFTTDKVSPGAYALRRAGTRKYESHLQHVTVSNSDDATASDEVMFDIIIPDSITIPAHQEILVTTGIHTSDTTAVSKVSFHIEHDLIELEHRYIDRGGYSECVIAIMNTTAIPVHIGSTEKRIATLSIYNDSQIGRAHV